MQWVIVDIWVREILIVLIGRMEAGVLFEGLTVQVVVHAAWVGSWRRLVLLEDPSRVSNFGKGLPKLLGELLLLLMDSWSYRHGLGTLTLHEQGIGLEACRCLVERLHDWRLSAEAGVLLYEVEVLLLLLMQLQYLLILVELRRPLEGLEARYLLRRRWS